ncbi:MAG: hypothetical protein KDK40_02645 [Chlamydiia bacterium]|nr:hypothetical protein [Chlamydiia bacterium]
MSRLIALSSFCFALTFTLMSNNAWSRSEGTVLRSFHMGPTELPPDTAYTNVNLTEYERSVGCGCDCGRCYEHHCPHRVVYHWCQCGAPFFDEQDSIEPFDQNATWPGKSESTWMNELKH